MRTTLDIDDEVLRAAKEISVRSKLTTGQVISDLARRALVASHPTSQSQPVLVDGFEVMPASGRVITADTIKKLMEDLEAS